MTNDGLQAAVIKGKAILDAQMGRGTHSLPRRIKDFLAPAGTSTGIECIVKGHHWYLGTPDSMRFQVEPTAVDDVPEDDTWSCFCTRCGAGSYFDTPPESCFDIDYWCYRCERVVPGDDLIDHANQHLEEDQFWPSYGPASVHGPEE